MVYGGSPKHINVTLTRISSSIFCGKALGLELSGLSESQHTTVYARSEVKCMLYSPVTSQSAVYQASHALKNASDCIYGANRIVGGRQCRYSYNASVTI